jgi:hypothetical protein
VDRQRFDADPDLDTTFDFDTDPDPDPDLDPSPSFGHVGVSDLKKNFYSHKSQFTLFYLFRQMSLFSIF